VIVVAVVLAATALLATVALPKTDTADPSLPS
jgi:hypothetical protein